MKEVMRFLSIMLGIAHVATGIIIVNDALKEDKKDEEAKEVTAEEPEAIEDDEL